MQQYMNSGNAATLQSICSCEEICRQTYTDWTAVSPETTETGVADLFYTVYLTVNFPYPIQFILNPELFMTSGMYP